MITTTTHTTVIGEVLLEERHTMIRLSAGSFGVGVAYRRPTTVTYQGTATRIPDVSMAVRAMAALLGMILMVVGARRRR